MVLTEESPGKNRIESMVEEMKEEVKELRCTDIPKNRAKQRKYAARVHQAMKIVGAAGKCTL